MPQIHEDAAANLKVSSTPTFFVDGVELTGEHALDKIDETLPPKAK